MEANIIFFLLNNRQTIKAKKRTLKAEGGRKYLLFIH